MDGTAHAAVRGSDRPTNFTCTALERPMNDARVPGPDTDTAPSGQILDELSLMVRHANRHDGDGVSLTGAFQRFARSARREGVLAERVVIALKRTYRTLIPPRHPEWTSRLCQADLPAPSTHTTGASARESRLYTSTDLPRPSPPDAA